MPPRLIVKKRPDPEPTVSVSEDLSCLEVSNPTVKRLVKRVIKKKRVISSESAEPEPEPEPEPVILQKDPIDVYMSSLNDSDRLVMDIAKDHLGTSFCMEKSVGFVEFLASQR